MKGRSKRFSTVAISVMVAVVLLAGTAVAAGIQIQQRDRDRTSYPHDEDRPINQYTQAPSSGAAASDAVEAVCDGGAAGETPVAYVGIEKQDRDRTNYPFGDDDNGSQGMQAQLQEQAREQARTCEQECSVEQTREQTRDRIKDGSCGEAPGAGSQEPLVEQARERTRDRVKDGSCVSE